MRSKKELRREILQLRDALTEKERKEKSHIITEKVIAQKEFIEADKVLLFASYRSEVETYEIFQAARATGKSVYYPKVMGKEMEFYLVEKEDDLSEGYWGIREPEAIPERMFLLHPEDKICVIMPGTVFDAEGNRIGYGGGYYDKFFRTLEGLHSKDLRNKKGYVYKLAIAFDCQIVAVGMIQKEDYDIKPDKILYI